MSNVIMSRSMNRTTDIEGPPTLVFVGKKKTDVVLRERLRLYVVRYMEERGLTQDEMGERLGTDQGHISAIVNSKKTLGLDAFVRLSKLLKLKADILLEEDPEPRAALDPSRVSPSGPPGRPSHSGPQPTRGAKAAATTRAR